MTPWLVALAVGAGSFLFRISMLVVAARAGVPPVAARVARYAVPVSFAVIATGGLLGEVEAGRAAAPPLGAAAAAVAAVRRIVLDALLMEAAGRAGAAVELVVGMPVLWLLSAALP